MVYEVIFFVLFDLIFRIILRCNRGDEEKLLDLRYIWIKKWTVFVDKIRLGKRERR